MRVQQGCSVLRAIHGPTRTLPRQKGATEVLRAYPSVGHDPLPCCFLSSQNQTTEDEQGHPRQRERRLRNPECPPEDALDDDALAQEPPIPVGNRLLV